MQAAFSSLQSRNEMGPFICKYIYTYMHILQDNFMIYIHTVSVYAQDMHRTHHQDHWAPSSWNKIHTNPRGEPVPDMWVT